MNCFCMIVILYSQHFNVSKPSVQTFLCKHPSPLHQSMAYQHQSQLMTQQLVTHNLHVLRGKKSNYQLDNLVIQVLLALVFSFRASTMMNTARHPAVSVVVTRSRAKTMLIATQFCDDASDGGGEVSDGDGDHRVTVVVIKTEKRSKVKVIKGFHSA